MTSPFSVPKLDDVAKAAGVSPATVSRTLNTPEMVSKDTLVKVRSAVDKLGYTPNFGARAMAAKRTMTIGAIIPTMENAIFAEGIQAFQEQLRRLGYTLLVSSNSYDPDLEADQIRTLVSRGADGILLIGYRRDESIYDFLRRRKIPFLLSWAFAANNAMPAIGFDNRAAMYRLCGEVLSLGHQKFGIISGTVAGNDRAANRLKGILERLKLQGITDAPVLETPFGIENGAVAMAQLMALPDRPTVVMCGNDVLAVGAIQCAQNMGLNVPADVSVTGFDGIELARVVAPKLTTVRVPHAEMGRCAAVEIVNMVENRCEGKSHELQSLVQLADSLCPPRAN